MSGVTGEKKDDASVAAFDARWVITGHLVFKLTPHESLALCTNAYGPIVNSPL